MTGYRQLTVSVAGQVLLARRDDGRCDEFAVSTARAGAGQSEGSFQTPLGRHEVRARIGQNAPLGAVFRGRRATGEVWSPRLHAEHPDRDWVLTRILWLRGLEYGHNRGGPVDSFARYIYIHGTPDNEPMGRPASHGCVRMRNEDIVRLFDGVGVGTPVDIVAGD